MKVLLTAASFSPTISGVQRHALNVARCLLSRSDISALHLVVAPWQLALVAATGLSANKRFTTHIAMMDRSSVSRNLWYYRQLPKLAARLQVDLVHLSYPVPIVTTALACPTVLTLHDVYPFEIPSNFGFPQVIFNRMILRRCLESVDAISCVSDATLFRLRQYTSPAVWRKAVRIHNCVEADSARAAQSPIPRWKGEPFLLCVAQHRHNKNIPLLIRSFQHLQLRNKIGSSMKLVIVGISGPETQRIRRLVTHYGLDSSVIFLEGLPESDLQWCYAQCEVLLAPSITEGFGLPVAEALLAGCRIVCSDIPAFRELDNHHCRFVMLGEDAEKAFADAIAASLQDATPEPITLPHLTSEIIANQYADLYRRLILSAELARGTASSASVETSIPERQFE